MQRAGGGWAREAGGEVGEEAARGASTLRLPGLAVGTQQGNWERLRGSWSGLPTPGPNGVFWAWAPVGLRGSLCPLAVQVPSHLKGKGGVS